MQKNAIKIDVYGTIDSRYENKIAQLLKKDKNFSFSGSGYNQEVSLRIAKTISTKSINMKLQGICLENCADIIFPAALSNGNLSFIGMPTIGYGYNSAPLKKFANRKSEKKINRCLSKTNFDLLWPMKSKKRKFNIFAAQEFALNIRSHSSNTVKDCINTSVGIDRKYWFPTSAQFKSIFGMNIPGKVCADVEWCIEASIIILGKNKDKFVVGSEVYILDKLTDGSGRVIKIGNLDFRKFEKL